MKFEISNTVSDDYVSNGKAKIGLTNITKQLDLIYDDKYMNIRLPYDQLREFSLLKTALNENGM